MAIGIIGKIGLGSLGTLGAGVTSLGAYHLLKAPDTIGEELQKQENLSLLKEEDPKWDQLLNKYKETVEENKPKKIKENESKDIDIQSKEVLQKECSKLWNTKLSKEIEANITRKKEEIKTWCIAEPKALSSEVN